MKNPLALLLLSAVLATYGVSCSSNPAADTVKTASTEAAPAAPVFRWPVRLTEKFNPSVSLPAAYLTINLLEVKDTRCPWGAVCIWAGDAAVKLGIIDHRARYTRPQIYTLHTNKALGTDTAYIGNYQLVLDSVMPYPRLRGPMLPKTVLLYLSPIYHWN